jgi:hypothetical protein
MTTNDKDTFFSRAQADADLTAQGRFKKETATRVTGVPTYPSMPPSSPWSSGFDQNVEPELGFPLMKCQRWGHPLKSRSPFGLTTRTGRRLRLLLLQSNKEMMACPLFLRRKQMRSRRKRKPNRRQEEWVCTDFPSCTCGRATEYSTQPLHRYYASAVNRWAIADSFVILNCMADHAPNAKVRFEAWCQLIGPKYDSYRRTPLFVRVQ